MNCENSTAPIDINNNPTGTCDLKCKFNYKYKESGSKLTNNTVYLSLTHDQVYPAPVNFNADDYQVSEIRIYSPSLHTYSGVHAEAEMIIVHTGTQGSLLVCLPIIKGNKTTTKSEKDIETIIQAAKKFARKPNEETPLQENFNLNNFIPKNKPFYSYKATLPYVPCNGEHNYVVFSKDDGAYITIYGELLKNLKSVITSHSTLVKKDTKFYINKMGANVSSGKAEEIYIDCKPVSDDGETIDESKLKSESKDIFKDMNFSDIKDNIFFKILFILLAIYLIYFIFNFLLKKVLGKDIVGGSSIQQKNS
jgi:carbonic anhydrase